MGEQRGIQRSSSRREESKIANHLRGCAPHQRSSSRREESKIAQGETLGKRSAEGFPPRRGGVKVFDPPFQGG